MPKNFRDALYKPSPYASAYLIMKEKNTDNYETAQQAFAERMEPPGEETEPEIKLPDTVKVKLNRYKQFQITVPLPDGKTFQKSWLSMPLLCKPNIRMQIQRSCILVYW